MRVLRDNGVGSFPTSDDFSVRGSDSAEKQIEFVSAKKGRLAFFPAWEHADRDLPQFTPPDVPIGTMEEAFDDADDNWRIIIVEHRGFVYVLEASDPNAKDFPRYYSAPQ